MTIFESDEDLVNKLKTLDLKKISDNMKEFNKIREADLLTNWCSILKKQDKAILSRKHTRNHLNILIQKNFKSKKILRAFF